MVLFLLKSSFRSWDIEYFAGFFFSFPKFPDSKGQTKKIFLKRLVTSSMSFRYLVFHYPVHIWGLDAEVKIKLTFHGLLFSWSYFQLNFSHALAVLGYLPKIRRVMRLVFRAYFLHTFSIKIFLIKYPIKWPSLTILGVWCKRLRYRNVSSWNPTRHSAIISLSHSQCYGITKETASLTRC